MLQKTLLSALFLVSCTQKPKDSGFFPVPEPAPEPSADTSASDTAGLDTADPLDSGIADTGLDTADTGADTDTDTDTDTEDPVYVMVEDFSLPDINRASDSFTQQISPRDHIQQVTGWYFIKAT